VIRRYQLSSKGPRASNQDYVLIEDLPGCRLLALVADGVGGNKGGEVASKTASETVVAALKEDEKCLEDGFEIADWRLKQLAQKDPTLAGMASTLTAILITGLHLTGAHAGDARVYVLRRNGIKQLTEDHTEAARLVRAGSLAKGEAYSHPYRNLLYSALGSGKDLVIETFAFDLLPKDRILIMSDGVYSVVSKRTFRDISVKHTTFENFCRSVREYVEAGKPRDNFSIVVLEVEEGTA
jgi:serine/threonine protein phosphatase PrpC